jgi:hypothetical protein
MPSPFPGMDPYLEACGAWSDFHSVYLAILRSQLNRNLPSGFVARTEDRVYIVPDERDIRPTQEVIEHFLEIRDTRRGIREVTMVIELLSPSNKLKNGVGRVEYVRKQKAVLNSATNLIEIDLLREGAHTVFIPKKSLAAVGSFDYLITRSDADDRQSEWFWRISLRSPLPIVQIPLVPELSPVMLDLQAAFDECWESSRYEDDLDYTTPLLPSLFHESVRGIEIPRYQVPLRGRPRGRREPVLCPAGHRRSRRHSEGFQSLGDRFMKKALPTPSKEDAEWIGSVTATVGE